MEGHLTELDRKKIVELYESRLSQHGHSHKTVGWGSVEDQILRFDMLCRGLDLKGKTILDVGCGLGDLVPYIDACTGGDFSYTGIDISPALIVSAQKNFKQSNVRFICAEMTALQNSEKYDITFLSGALSYRVDDNIGYTKLVLSKLLPVTRQTVAVNFLSTYVDYQDKKNFHYSPEEIFKYAKSLTRWVTIYHDYPLWEFTVQLHHTPQTN